MFSSILFKSLPRRTFSQARSFATKKLLLLSLDWKRPKDPPMSLGQASLFSHLKENNIPVLAKSYAVNDPSFSTDSVAKFIINNCNQNTDLGMGAYVWNERPLLSILSSLKKFQFPGRIILGGPQISYLRKSGLLEKFYAEAHVFIRGYAEDALVKLMQAQKIEPISGVHYANTPDDGSSTVLNPQTLSSPLLNGIVTPQPFMRVETKRGCLYRCAYCQHSGSNPLVEFPLSRVIKEVQWITAHPVINDIAVIDPTFNVGNSYLLVLKEFAKQKFSGKISFQCKAERVTGEFLDAVESLNTYAKTTLEFGLQTIHKKEARAILRSNQINKIKEVFLETKRRNINTEISIIYGLPNQTLESFRQTILFCNECGIKAIRAFPLLLLRGTILYNRKEELALKESNDLIPCVVESPSFTYSHWREMEKIAKVLEDSYKARIRNC
jgi:radical SAM superfamily enzyme YgiQ (UPF0313 family)